MNKLREYPKYAAGIIFLFFAVVLLTACAADRSLAPVDSKRTSRPSVPPGFYKVRSGDTLFKIAFQYGQDYKQLARWNRIRRPYTIYVGQKIRLRPSKSIKANKKQSTREKQLAKKRATQKRRQPAVKSRTQSKPRKTAKSTGKLKWRWPTKGKVIKRFSSRATGRNGIDIAGKSGQPVKAAEGGRVVYAGGGLLGYGKLIIIKHNDTFLSAYAHNRRILVKEGDNVKPGQRIGEMGKTGTDGIKLHFEIRRNGRPVNPQRYLPG